MTAYFSWEKLNKTLVPGERILLLESNTKLKLFITYLLNISCLVYI